MLGLAGPEHPELAEEVAKATGYEGLIEWDTSKPDALQKNNWTSVALRAWVGEQRYLLLMV